MKRKMVLLVPFAILAVLVIVTGAALQAHPTVGTPVAPTASAAPANLVASGGQLGLAPFLDLSSFAGPLGEAPGCGPAPAKLGGLNPPFSCKCWQEGCINDACWSGLILVFCGPN